MSTLTDERLADRLLERRIVLLGEEVTDELANRVVSQLLVLSADDPDSDISIFINSPGGSVLAGLAIYDTMQLVPNDVDTVAIGLAASMGQVLLCGGAVGKRFALPGRHDRTLANADGPASWVPRGTVRLVTGRGAA